MSVPQPENNRPWRPDTRLHEIFKSPPAKYRAWSAAFAALSPIPAPLHAFLLMACVEEQTHFLASVWGEKAYADIDTLASFRALCDTGLFPYVLAPDSELSRRLLQAVQAGIAAGKRMGAA